MGFLRRLFGPDNALILSFEEHSQATEDQILEVRRYYELVKVGDIVDSLLSGANPAGLAAVSYRNARKGFFLSALPFLLGEKIPFTLFLRPDCIGLNRLPPEEELEAYASAYPSRVSETEVEEGRQTAWGNPEAAEAHLISLRREIGPLPIESIAPTRFFATWGKIIDIPPERRELGLHVYTEVGATLRESLAFSERQTSAKITTALVSRDVELAPLLRTIGMKGVVTARSGAITRTTSAWELPNWDLKA